MLQTQRFGTLQKVTGIIMFGVNGMVTIGGGDTGHITAMVCSHGTTH
jgi:hypothetical protein